MICKNCNATNYDSNSFCEYCGTPLKPTQPNIPSQNQQINNTYSQSSGKTQTTQINAGYSTQNQANQINTGYQQNYQPNSQGQQSSYQNNNYNANARNVNNYSQ